MKVLGRFFAFLFIALVIFSSFAPFGYAAGADTVVYITKTGHCYHRENCTYLKSCIPTTLQSALDNGYDACSRCKPPREVDSVGKTNIEAYKSGYQKKAEEAAARQAEEEKRQLEREREAAQKEAERAAARIAELEAEAEKKDRQKTVIVWLTPAVIVFFLLRSKNQKKVPVYSVSSYSPAPVRQASVGTVTTKKLYPGLRLYGKHKRTGNVNYVVVVQVMENNFIVEYFGKRYPVPYSDLGVKLFYSYSEAQNNTPRFGFYG